MGDKLSIKTRLFAVTAAVLVIACTGAARAGAATTTCGNNCQDFSSQLYGSSSSPAFVLADAPNLASVGQPLTQVRASNTNPGEDFAASVQGLVSDFVAAGLMAPQMDFYGSREVIEIDYTPNGAFTGLCAGVPTTPGNGTRVLLEPCGVTCKTCWIIDASGSFSPPDAPLIQGATSSNFLNPPVLTTALPGQPLTTSALRVGSNGAFPANQLWGVKTGPL